MVLAHVLQEHCPRCYKGKVFKTSLLSFKLGEMHPQCTECGLNFTKEPGFYWGAMYVSYALGTIECFLTYFACRLLGTDTFDMINLWSIIGVILVLAPFNFKLARVIWLYIFAKDV